MVGRVSAEYRASYDVIVDGEVYEASLRGRFHNDEVTLFPKVGDYVEVVKLEPGKVAITEVQERKNQIVRRAPHTGDEQVMVANVDYLCIVMGLDEDFNTRRLERYIALAHQSDVTPIIILNKADIASDLDAQTATVADIAPGIPVFVIAAATGAGIEALEPYLTSGTTLVLLGSSGAGKSTLTNTLLETSVQATHSLRERDGRGRHTTTNRQLFVLPSGAHLIDTPGMRELALLDEDTALNSTFADIAQLAQQCRFRNCDHEKSAGCAIIAAVAAGELDEAVVESYLKLQNNTERTRRIRGR